MQVFVQGEPRQLPDGATVADLLRALDDPARQGIAVEVNRTIVRRADHATRRLEEGDRVEVVGLVGGG